MPGNFKGTVFGKMCMVGEKIQMGLKYWLIFWLSLKIFMFCVFREYAKRKTRKTEHISVNNGPPWKKFYPVFLHQIC
jgi:hypothetical protein